MRDDPDSLAIFCKNKKLFTTTNQTSKPVLRLLLPPKTIYSTTKDYIVSVIKELEEVTHVVDWSDVRI